MPMFRVKYTQEAIYCHDVEAKNESAAIDKADKMPFDEPDDWNDINFLEVEEFEG